MINYESHHLGITAMSIIDNTFYWNPEDRLIAMYLAECQYHDKCLVVFREDNLATLAWRAALTKAELYQKLREGVFPYRPVFVGVYKDIKNKEIKDIIAIKCDEPGDGDCDMFYALELDDSEFFLMSFNKRTTPDCLR